MQKFGLLTCRTSNIGDEIQNLAAAQFLPQVDSYVNRDRLSAASALGPLAMILNGWFLHSKISFLGIEKYDWLPPDNIKPLFVSFHARSNRIVNKSFRSYFKKYEPIGCRDYFTLGLFKSIGVEAYFSGCLTLTLPRSSLDRGDQIYFVDPFGASSNYQYYLPGHYSFRSDLWEKFPKNVRDNAVFLTHQSNELNVHERYKNAQQLLSIYSQAKLVVTSRLHCALPCLAFGTPVVFLHNGKSDVRFGGLIELFKQYSFDDVLKGDYDIDWINPKPNQANINPLIVNLRRECEQFVKIC